MEQAAEEAQFRFLSAQLSCGDKLVFGEAKTLAQIISGSAFLVLSFWLIFASTAKLAVAQKANLEQRMHIATILTAVALFSGFFNIMQLTKIQEVALPRATQFTVDLARPAEWICTCPILQLALVILGGSRIPSYRRYMMPALSVSVLLCGTASMFTESMLRWVWYGFGCILVLILFYHNLQQIKENSDGAESIWRGSSDFRILSILLIALLFPFPIWFIISPEGVGLVTDIVTINMGWVVLNITAKFSFIIYMQFAKMRVQTRKDATRELYAVQPAELAQLPDKAEAWSSALDKAEAWSSAEGPGLAAGQLDVAGYLPYGFAVPRPQLSDKLTMVATEAMVCLGLSQHTDRSLSLLAEQHVTSLDDLEKLNQERCMDRTVEDQLLRLLDRVDVSKDAILAKLPSCAAEPNMEPAEFVHVGERLAIMMQRVEATKEELAHRVELAKEEMMQNFSRDLRNLAAQVDCARADVAEQVRRSADSARDDLLEKLATYKVNILEKVSASEEHLMQRVLLVGQNVELSKEVFLQRASAQDCGSAKLDSLRQDLLQQVEAAGQHVLERVAASLDQTQAVREHVVEAVRLAQESLQRSIEATRGEILQKADTSEAGQESTRRECDSKLLLVLSKLESYHETAGRTQGDLDGCIASFLSRVHADTERHQRGFAERLGNLLDKLLRAQEDHMIDIRRMNMMVMENVNAAQERAQASIDIIAAKVSCVGPAREGSRTLPTSSRHEEEAGSDVGSLAASAHRGYSEHGASYGHE